MLWEQFLNFSKVGGKKPYANVEFEMLSAQCSQMVPACYLNISGPVLKRVQGCSLTSLCLPSAASDSQRKTRGIITALASAWEYVWEKHLI